MEKLRYKSHTLSYNPERLAISNKKRLARAHAPYMGELVHDLGPRAVEVRGEGELFGSGAMLQYHRLYGLYAEGGTGLLFLPEHRPFYAIFASFTGIGEAGRRGFRYAFEFVEDIRAQFAAQKGAPVTHIAREGETLFDIAADYRQEVGVLLTQNPAILSPNSVTPGTAVLVTG